MSAAAHILAILFAAPAGTLAYFVLAIPESPRLGLHHLLATIILFIIPLVGIPEAAGTTVLAFLAAGGVTRAGYRRRHRRHGSTPDPPEPSEPIQQPSTQQDPPRTGPHGEPIVFQDQFRDD